MKDKALNWYKRHKKLTIIGGIILLLLVIGSLNSDSAQRTATTPAKSTQKQEATTQQKKADTAGSNAKPAEPAPTKTKLQELKDSAGDDALIFPASSTNGDLATSESQAPFKIVINYTNSVSCSAAKTSSYDTIKSIYANNHIRDMVDQIVITYPGRLVTSLSGIDGRSTNSWSGETNFYKVMFGSFEASQRDPAGQKTWVVSINGCR